MRFPEADRRLRRGANPMRSAGDHKLQKKGVIDENVYRVISVLCYNGEKL